MRERLWGRLRRASLRERRAGAMHLGFAIRVWCALQVLWIGVGGASKIGVIYGDEAAAAAGGAENAVQLLQSQGISKIRLYDADSGMLRALSRSSIEVIVGLRNDELIDVGVSKTSAHSWVVRNVAPYFPQTNITAIAVGNEVLTSEDESLVPFLLPALRNIHAALVAAGWETKIKVSTPQSLHLLSTFSPPSSATFKSEFSSRVVESLLEFLSSTDSFFMLNVFPFDVYQDHRSDLSLGHALFSSPGGSDDPVTGLHYSNKFAALVDAVFVAMAGLKHPELRIVVTEAGWSRTDESSDGSVGEAATSFRQDILRFISSARGTPLKSKSRFDVYVHGSLLSDASRTSGESEFSPDEQLLWDGLDRRVPAAEASKRRLLAQKTWCVARSDANTADLQAALDWACGQGGADCRPIQQGQFCFLPNTMQAHASYAFNSYYQSVSWAAGSCDFGGLAVITKTDPSYTGCLYLSSGTDPLNSTNGSGSAAVRAKQSRSALTLAWLSAILLVSWTFMEL